MAPFSISTTGTPQAAARVATAMPPGPPPITQMSGVNTSVIQPLVPSYYAASRTRQGEDIAGDGGACRGGVLRRGTEGFRERDSVRARAALHRSRTGSPSGPDNLR